MLIYENFQEQNMRIEKYGFQLFAKQLNFALGSENLEKTTYVLTPYPSVSSHKTPTCSVRTNPFPYSRKLVAVAPLFVSVLGQNIMGRVRRQQMLVYKRARV